MVVYYLSFFIILEISNITCFELLGCKFNKILRVKTKKKFCLGKKYIIYMFCFIKSKFSKVNSSKKNFHHLPNFF